MTHRGTEVLHQRYPVRRQGSIRQVLAVIPDMTGLYVSLESPLISDNINNDRRDRISPSWHPIAGVASSPDEMVIQKRGRRSRSIIWSPDADSKRNSLLNYSLSDKTSDKINNELHSPIVIREHMPVRKRLELSGDFDESQLTTLEKKKKSHNSQTQYTGSSITNGLKGLSNDQLVKMLIDLVSMQEEGNLPANANLRDVVMKLMPIADIKPLQEKLYALQRNVYGSLITSNEFAYIRAYMHLEAFQKSLDDQGNVLVQSQHWTALMQYVITAWSIIKDLPEFESEDNTAQKCYAKLINFCKQALLNGNFTNSALETYTSKMKDMIQDYCDVKVCLQMAKEMMQ